MGSSGVVNPRIPRPRRPRRTRRAGRLRPLRVALAAALAAGLAGCTSQAQPGPTALPLRPTASASFDTAELVDLLDELVAAGAPAAVIEVRDGDEAWSHAAGVQSLASERPARPGHTFRIASLTKPMLAAIVLQLVDEGRLDLDDPFAEHVPGPLDDAPAPVTVRQLLDHTSGLPEYVDGLTAGAHEIPDALSTPRTDEELLALATDRPWRFEPGERFEYSNSNYIALTMLAERLTGRSLAELVDERIAEPLGLASTRLPDDDLLSDPHLHGYWVDGALRVNVTLQQASLWSGAGGIESNAADVNTFVRALVRGLVVPPELLGEMLALGPDGYGLGVQGRVDACGDGGAPVLLPIEAGEVPEAVPEDADGAAPTDGDADADADAPGDGASPDAGGEDALPTDSDAPAPDLAGPDDDFLGDADADADADGGAGAGDAGAEGDADDGGGAAAEPTSGALETDPAGAVTVRIGEPVLVYGHLGSGLGYRSIALASPDGVRQVTIAWTASPTDYGADPRVDLAYRLADAALAVGC
ncbi:MAG: beta-lactamase family protein [Microbacteriaceae bacterium]|nr:beta-lactamase family protein [Microbacteriaceae bacterium]